MARRIVPRDDRAPASVPPSVDADTAAAAAAMASLVAGTSPRKKRRPSPTAAARLPAYELEVESMAAGEQPWAKAVPAHFVALCCRCHRTVYGLDMSVSQKDAVVFGSLVRRALETRFGGDREKLFQFMMWAWARESGRHKWRSENGREPKRLTVPVLMSTAIYDDYRQHLLHERRRGG